MLTLPNGRHQARGGCARGWWAAPAVRPGALVSVLAGLLVGVLMGVLVGVWPGPALAQDEPAAEGSGPIRVLDREAAAALARRLAQPRPPAGAPEADLRRHFTDQVDAARRLGDLATQERVLRDALEALPQDARWPNDMGLLLRDAGRLDEAVQMFDRAIVRSQRPANRLFFQSNRLSVPVRRGADVLLREALDLRQQAQALLPSLPSGIERLSVLRALAATHTREAEALQRRGQFSDALAAHERAVQGHRDALAAVQAFRQPAPSMRSLTVHGLAAALRDGASALARTGRLVQAEAQVNAVVQLARDEALSPTVAAGAHHLLAGLRMRRGEWAEAERQLRLSLQVLDGLGYARSHPFQTQRTRDLLLVLWADGRPDAALRELDQMDRALQAQGVAAVRGRYPFERGLVWLATGRAADAAREFAVLERVTRAETGPEHAYTAQAQALRGAALWLTGDAAQRAAAAQALEAGVSGLLLPRNADFSDDSYARAAVRSLVFGAYLEAMAWRGGASSVAALRVADRLLAGATGQAMSDAALRAAAGQPALADLLRREQDARLLAQGLLDELRDGDGADAARRADDETTALRQRLGEAETALQRVRDELRAQHPEFDRLLRPPAVLPADVARHLAADEALLLALPTERALYLWAVRADAPVVFARVDLGRYDLQQRVQRLREGLDLGASGGRTPRFDRTLSFELYQAVLAPVAAALAGRRHLVVATGGPLASLPFAALSTRADDPDAWVAQTWALSQVPSVAAWLALRQLPPARPAPEPLLAWADPAYSLPPAAGGRTPAARAADGPALSGLPPLPETRDEAQAIARALKANPERDLLLGPRATRDSVLAASRSGALARKRVVVFATHGLSPGDLPGLQQPALALAAAGDGADPLSTLIGLDDILGLKLNADWVVLSACNTAGGDGRRSESLSGLARGFLYAGSRSLLVTHWAVESDSARMLTTATFEHQAANPQASKADSLRQAMLRVKAQPKYAHPAFWAPFALVGDGAR